MERNTGTPTIDGGVVNAPISSDPRYPTNNNTTTQDFAQSTQTSQGNNPSATGPSGSTNSNDPVTASYGNTHSTTGRTNPIHPSDPQSTAHPAYGSSGGGNYEVGGANPGQGQVEGMHDGSLGTGGHGGLGGEYHESVDAAYGHATGREFKGPRPGVDSSKIRPMPYDTAGGNPGQQGGGQTTTAGTGESRTAGTDVGNGVSGNQHHLGRDAAVGAGGAGLTEHEHYQHQQDVGVGTTASTTTNTQPTSSKIKQSASGIKGLAAAVHGTGEAIRGNFNAGVDKAFHDKSGEVHNQALAQAGKNEMESGQFSTQTKNREGVLPGADGDRRKHRAL